MPPRRTLWTINQPPAIAVRALLLFLLTTRKTSVNRFDFQPFTLTREQKPPPPLSKFPDQFPITYFSGLVPSVTYFFRLAAASKLSLKSNKTKKNKKQKKRTPACVWKEKMTSFESKQVCCAEPECGKVTVFDRGTLATHLRQVHRSLCD